MKSPRVPSAMVLMAAFLLWLLAVLVWPHPSIPGVVPGPPPDSADYAYGARALLQGNYVVDWDGSPRVPRYTPGFSLLLMPAVALGGVEGAIWATFFIVIATGILAAALAAQLSNARAAPLAVLFTVFIPSVMYASRMVMSDLPSAALILAEVLLLTSTRGVLPATLAGVLGGYLVWLRPAAAVLLLAGLAGISGSDRRRHRAAGYLLGAIPVVLLLATWQYFFFGSPLVTSYQAAGASPEGSGEIGAFFSLNYVLGAPFRIDSGPLSGIAHELQLPNAIIYPLQLIGIDFFLSLPGVGFLGLVALVRFAQETGPARVVGRFGLATLVVTYLVYVPYFWQSARFMLIPSTLLNVAAAAQATRWLARRYGTTAQPHPTEHPA